MRIADGIQALIDEHKQQVANYEGRIKETEQAILKRQNVVVEYCN